ncbi:MAG TPA: thioesterase family protein [Acidimicrobiia bacterium]|nr:thioesterase family protein [Acidimicrobiia bacterium]
MSEAVFALDGDRFQPQPVSRARWYDEVLHGGPVAALFARQVELVESSQPMMVTRLTVDLMRPVPTKPISVATRVLREGRRIQVVDATMESEGVEVARASALRMRVGDIQDLPEHPRRPAHSGPDGLDRAVWRGDDDGIWFHSHAVEMRFAEGNFYEPGPATAWMRMVVPLVEGEDPSPLQQIAALSDFGNGVSRVLASGWWFINADLTVYLERYPESEWILLRSRTDIDDEGVGLAQSELFDREGSIGHALQSLFVDRAEQTQSGF